MFGNIIPYNQSAKTGKTNVFFFTTVDWYFASHRLHLAETLISQGYNVFLLSNYSESKDQIEKKGIKAIDFYTPQSSLSIVDGLNIFRIINLIIKFKPTIIHSIALKPLLLTALISPLFPQIKFIHAISGFGSSFAKNHNKTKLKTILKFKIIQLILNSRNNAVIVQNKSDYKILSKYIEQQRLHLIRGSGVDTNKFKSVPQPIKISELKVIKVLFPSRLIWEKGIKYYAESAKILTKKYPNLFQFDIAGRLYPANKYCLTTEDMKVLEQQYPVKWLGNLQSMFQQYLNYQIVCLPSFYNEGVPRVLIEAASCGIPCVTTDHPGCNDIIIHNYNGKIVPIKNAQAIANAIEEIIFNDQFYLKLSQNARKRVIENFSSQLINEATISLYHSALAPISPLLKTQTNLDTSNEQCFQRFVPRNLASEKKCNSPPGRG